MERQLQLLPAREGCMQYALWATCIDDDDDDDDGDDDDDDDDDDEALTKGCWLVWSIWTWSKQAGIRT